MEKTILLAGRPDDEQHTPLIEAMLETGPVQCDESGFKWRSQPEYQGLHAWVGSVEIDDEGDFYFDGTWESPTSSDLADMAGLDVQQIGNLH